MSTEPRCVPAPKDPYFRDAEQFFAVDKYMFSRRGCWLALSIDDVRYGKGSLYLTTNRGT